MDSTIPSAFKDFLLQFSSAFTAPSFQNFVTLVTGWILAPGRHTISRVIQFGSGRARKKQHAALYRFFSRARWVVDEVSRILFRLALPLIPEGTIVAMVDDTLCRRSGPHVWGAGMHHDPLISTYGRGTKAGRKAAFAFGLNWVIVSVWVPFPWNRERGIAIPILFRLYRSKKRTPKSHYHKRTELAAEMIEILAGWIPEGRALRLSADTEYACQSLVQARPEGVGFVGPVRMDAALYEIPVPKKNKNGKRPRGQPRKKGKRMPSPKQIANDPSIRWKHQTVSMYGQKVEVMTKTFVCLWYRVAHTTPVRIVITRDPKGRIEDRAYFSTEPELSEDQILQTFSRRWSAEVLHRDAKQHLGLENPQNGWWRRPHGKRLRKKKPGPQPDRRRGEKAIRRTVPIAFVAYTLVVVWYLKHGSWRRDVRRMKKLAPWYGHKEEPSFADMLHAARRELWRARLLSHPSLRAVSHKILEVIPQWLLAA